MPPVQTTYAENQAPAFPGMPANANYSADTKIVETVAGIGFGLAVGRGTGVKQAVLGASAANRFLGLSIKDSTQIGTTADTYPRYENMGVMFKGDMWVTVGADVTAGTDVTFSSTTGVLSSAAASGSQFTIAGAVWMTSAASGALAIVRLSGALPAA